MASKTTVCPFLMFTGQAEEAMSFYVSTLPESSVISIVRYGPEGPGPAGTVMRAEFSIAGQRVMCTDTFIKHGFTFTPSSSLFVTCTSEEEIRRLAGTLSKDGAELMPLGEYGFSRRFAWVQDRFGVSWQLNLG